MSLSLSDEFDLGWLVGFVEAEGSFTSKKGRPYFTLGQNDKQILEIIKSSLGFGTVRKAWRKGRAWRFTAYSKRGLEWLINCFNSKLRTEPKRQQFKRWIDLFNLNIKFKRKCYAFLETSLHPKGPLFDDGWLIGFVEGEGAFTYNKTDGWPFFTIVQNDKGILETIKDFFGFGAVYKHCRRVDCRAWRYVVVHNWNNLSKLRDFFDGRLRTAPKRQQFKFWVSLFDSNHPIRIKGRGHERLRSRESYRRNPEKNIEAVKRWKRNNPEKVKEYKRKSWHKCKDHKKLKRDEKRQKLAQGNV